MMGKLLEMDPIIYSLVRLLRWMDPRQIAMKDEKENNNKKLEITLNIMVDHRRVEESNCGRILFQYSRLSEKIQEDEEIISEFNISQDRLETLFHSTRHRQESQQFRELWGVIEQLLLLSHGQASVERGFSTNKELTEDNLSKESLIARRQIVELVQQYGGPDRERERRRGKSEGTRRRDCEVADFKYFGSTVQSNVQVTIREYLPSDQRVVKELFCDGVRENIYPAFFKSMSHPDHVGVTLSICVAGYVLGGSSYFQALLFGAAWAGLIYFCCHDIYEGYMLRRLSADMADIQTNYLDNPNNGFWVAVVGDSTPSRVVGMVMVMGRREVEEDDHRDNLNGGMGTGSSTDGSGDSGEMSCLVVAFPWRRKRLGSQLTQRALDFCKERGFARLLLDVSSPQTGAISLLRKAGFMQTSSHSNTHGNHLIAKLARISVIRMERFL
ncbi:uncharacterized protein LOC133495288 [Syngnathoides biaculeatus]|uniref:uncharacterized protein LOC133495288 n=1 Tax=Syngnathoides biaculeatus TaxID=300417 RepID=UPI002ADE733E|nr:uncharacterized protein LOC133495288 [Syngnathoides biaculeatus]